MQGKDTTNSTFFQLFKPFLSVDEPTGSLDEKTGLQILKIFKALHKQNITIIIATHDNSIANSCKRVIRLVDGVMSLT